MGSKPKGISASRGAAILGLNEYQTQFEIWQIIKEELYPGFNSLHGYVMPEPPDNAAIRWGLAFEDSVCRLASKVSESDIFFREKFFEPGIMTCHIDGAYINFEILHEGKTTSVIPFSKKWGEPGTDKIPRAYQVQCQHQMACTGIDEVILSVLVFPKAPEEWESEGLKIIPIDCGQYNIEIPGQEEYEHTFVWAKVFAQAGFFHQYYIKRNQELIDKMIEQYSIFWDECIIGDKIPEPANIDDIKRMCPEPKGTIILPDNIAEKYQEYKLITKEIGGSGEMAKRKEALKVEILNAVRLENQVIDDESTDKWLFYDRQGEKLGSFGKDKRGIYAFR